ncbi:hypothetical protein ACJX0J_026996 [Zea mays]
MTEEDVATFIQFVWSFFCITCYIVVLILHVATHIPSWFSEKIKLQQARNVEPEIMSNIEYSLQIFLTNNKIYKHFLKMNLRGSVIILEGLGLAAGSRSTISKKILYLPRYIGNDTSLQHVAEVAAWLRAVKNIVPDDIKDPKKQFLAEGKEGVILLEVEEDEKNLLS